MAHFHISLSSRVLHFKQPAGTSRGVYTTRRSYFIKLTDDSCPGICGWGECAPLPDLSCDTMSSVAEYERTLQALCDNFCLLGHISYDSFRPYPSMLFGLETALWQLRRGGSTQLSETPFARGESGIPINGLVWMGTFEEMDKRLEEKLHQGFRCVKLKIGAIDFERELELVKHVRSRFTKLQVELRLDANGGFSTATAMNKIEALARYDIHSIEQPIRQHQWGDMARLCRESPIPIALDEELIGVNLKSMKAALLDTIRPQYIILKPSLHGGIFGCREWIELGRQRGIGSWMTSALESNVGLNAIAHLAAETYGPNIEMPQGLGTGQLFTDNIDMPLRVEKARLWYGENKEDVHVC